MLSVVDCVFIGFGFILCTVLVMTIMAIKAFRAFPSQQQVRSEPVMPAQKEQAYSLHSPWDAGSTYEGFTGVIHIHGVKTGDTFRAVVTDNNSKCKLEKLIRVRG